MNTLKSFIVFLLITGSVVSYAQEDKSQLTRSIEQHKVEYAEVALKSWNYAEVGYKEFKSSALLQDELKKAGFTVTSGGS